MDFGDDCRERGGFLGLLVNQGTQNCSAVPFPHRQTSTPSALRGCTAHLCVFLKKRVPLLVVLGAGTSGSFPGPVPKILCVSLGMVCQSPGTEGTDLLLMQQQGEPKPLMAEK